VRKLVDLITKWVLRARVVRGGRDRWEAIWQLSLRRGVLGGDEHWLAIWALGLLIRLLVRKHPRPVVTQRIALGETLVIRQLPAPPRGRAARRAARASQAG
jgi:hypothetical protein